ncbi:hypothetical protein ABZU32_39170 [Sphaerisporangium sp. NPDC005288]|uniref:hypothetical protein n=1 Tax=Sphaerisporangium sp. NPDC005288 TaxID=3155114 RepID=UPI0033A50168
MSAAARSSSSAGRFKAVAGARLKDAETGQTPERGTSARRTKPIRITIDLTPEDYQRMKDAVAELARVTDIPTLAHSRMWRALLHQIQDDPDLLAEVAAQIKADQD